MECGRNALKQRNWDVMALCSGYLRSGARILPEQVDQLQSSCGIGEEEAVLQLLCAQCGLDYGQRGHREIIERYLRPGLRRLDPGNYRAAAYRRILDHLEVQQGRWQITQAEYRPFEIFVRDDLQVLADGREIPQLGYFGEPFPYATVRENGNDWMTLAPVEINSMKGPVSRSKGEVVTLGLGLGYFAFEAGCRREVSRLTVVERDAELISMFRERLLPAFPCREKIALVCMDAFEYVRLVLPRRRPDYLFCDIWHDAGDGLPLYQKLKREIPADLPCDYWIENLLRAREQMLEASDE